MEIYRKYFSDEQLRNAQERQPDWGVTVRTVGHNVHQPKANYPDGQHPNSYYFDWQKGRVLDEFQLVYIANGRGTFEADGVSPTIIEAGTVFLLYPNVWHRFRPSEETGWEEFWVGYKGHYADYLMRQDCFKPTAPFISTGYHCELLNVFMQLIETVKFEGIAYRQLASCLVTQLLGLVYSSALMTNAEHQNKTKVIQSARFKMHERMHQAMDMEQLAKELNVGYPWFRKAFKEIMGTSPGQYHLNIRLESATRLLKETDLTVTQISHQLGFESEFYFSRIFKKKIGVAPRHYRQNKLALVHAA